MTDNQDPTPAPPPLAATPLAGPLATPTPTPTPTPAASGAPEPGRVDASRAHADGVGTAAAEPDDDAGGPAVAVPRPRRTHTSHVARERQRAPQRPGRMRRFATAVWKAVAGLPESWPKSTAFGGGMLAGITLLVLYAGYLQPLLDRPAGLEPGDLVILSGRDDGAGNQRQALVDQWNALHPDNQARIEEIAAVADAQHSEMVARAQSGSEDVDIYNLDVTWTAEFASEGYVRPLDDKKTSDDADADGTAGFLSGPLQTCRYAGRLWALPFNTDAGLLYYRNRLVDAAPATWPQLVDKAQTALSRPAPAGPQPTAGYAGQLADYEGLTVNALEAIWAAGGDVVDARGQVVIDSPEAQIGLTRLATGLGSPVPPVILPESIGFDETATTQAFAQGKVVFMRNWPVAHRALEPPAGADSAAAVEFQVAKLPGPSALGGQNLAIAAKSRHPRAARRLIEFLTGERSQQLLFERGGFAATREIVYRDATVAQLYRYAPTLLEAIRSARTRPITPHYAQFSATFRAIVREALADGGRLPSDAKSRLQGALQGYKR